MSRGEEEYPKNRAEALRELTRELRQSTGLGASFFRAAAGRIDVSVTDLEVIEVLATSGLMTAGQLADLTGLTTGAITGMLNRLEEAGIVRRERDPNDGRRVIVRLVPENDGERKIGVFDSIEKAWEELVAQYDDEQIALLVDFLRRSNALSRREIVRLREAPESEEGIYSAPLEGLESGRLVVSSGLVLLALRADDAMTELYRARFEGPLPEVKAREGVVTIRYPRRLWSLMGEKRSAEVMLSTAIPWEIAVQGGTAAVNAELGGLNLTKIEIKGGLSSINLELPVPSGMVPIRISGAASDITVRRPANVAVRAHLKGWVSTFIFDDQMFGNMGSDVWLQSPNYDTAVQRYDIEIASSASMVTVASD